MRVRIGKQTLTLSRVIGRALRKPERQQQSYCRVSSFTKNVLPAGRNHREAHAALGLREETDHCLLRVIECFLFGPIVIRTGFAAKAPHVVQRLIAIPACAFRPQCGHAGCRHDFGRLAGFGRIANVVCLIHDSAPKLKHWATLARESLWQKYSPIRDDVEKPVGIVVGTKPENGAVCLSRRQDSHKKARLAAGKV